MKALPEKAEKRVKGKRGKRGTRTSSFGAPGRISHDASPFYAGRLYDDFRSRESVEYEENAVPLQHLDRIFCKSSETMEELPGCSVHLMVTSPPYNVGKEYDKNVTLNEYRDFLRRVWKEVYRVLVPGGRACINVANLGRKPYIPLHLFLVSDMLDLGFFMRGEIVWNKASRASPSTAWGSWLSPANPTLRDVHEYILVFSKETLKREKGGRKMSTISREEFLEFTKSVWTFPPQSARKAGHPAPFPLELPYRLIQLYTFKGEVVLDPFMGSGQTALAAIRAARRFMGYETEEEYVKLAENRIKKYLLDPEGGKII